MNARKRIVKIAYGLDAALMIVLVGLLIYQQRLIRQMSNNGQQMPLSAAISDSSSPAENNTQTALLAKHTNTVVEGGVEKLAAKVEQLRSRLEAVEEELETAREDLADTMAPDEEWQKFLRQSVAFAKKERENPTLMKAKRRGAEDGIVNNYGVLFERLGLPDEKLQNLKALMADNEIEVEYLEMHAGGRLPPWTDEDRQEILQQIEDQEAEFENQVMELLGSENYEIYNAYEERLGERSIVTMESRLAGIDLSDEKAQELIDAMYEARKEVDAEYGIDQTEISPGSVEAVNHTLDAFDSYIESAWRVLSESQAEQFEARINERKENLKLNFPAGRDGDDESQ